jgi:hypothetical protein
MKTERNDVGFPLWRKKVDKTLFMHGSTPIPTWAGSMWSIPTHFSESNSRSDPRTKVTIKFGNRTFPGWVTASKTNPTRSTKLVRLWFDDELKHLIKQTFPMSYMRSLEDELSARAKPDAEERIPFWEFLDIEFDQTTKTFRFEAYYKQTPAFPNLFARLVGSPNLERVSDQLKGKNAQRILKQDWKERSQYRFEIGANNVIYLLADSNKKHLYVGEAGNLIRRLDQGHPSILNWDRFRYDVLPDSLAPFRVQIERMLIRYLAALMPNRRNILHLGITEFRIINDKVDR